MFSTMLKRATIYFLAFAITLGVTLQTSGSALAAAGQSSMMHMGSDCEQPAAPCKGLTPDCINIIGCVINAAAPVAPLAISEPLLWGDVSYFSLNAVSVGVSIKPEHSPPIPCA